MKNSVLLLFAGLIVFLFNNCNEQKKIVQRQNQAVLYKPSTNIVRPEFTVFHTSDSISVLYVKIYLDDLVFNQANPQNKLIGKVRINYMLIPTGNSTATVVDSATIIRELTRTQAKQVAVLSIPVKAKIGLYYKVKVEVYDMIRELGNQSFVTIDKLNGFSGQNFKIIPSGQTSPTCKPYFSSADSFRIVLNKPVETIFIKYSADRSVLPQPPFSSLTEPAFAFQTDSVWQIKYSDINYYSLKYPGLYLIQKDTTQAGGYFLANFGVNFPEVNQPNKLIPPLEYITTSEEFRNLRVYASDKLIVDSFWLSQVKSIESARELIRIYYNRMQYANLYFSSYKEGWKTDRGMIYLLFGPPSYIRKTISSETWEYYVPQNGTNLTISFIKAISPYTDNHYIMQHNDSYTSFWRDAVASWRKGTAYTLED